MPKSTFVYVTYVRARQLFTPAAAERLWSLKGRYDDAKLFRFTQPIGAAV